MRFTRLECFIKRCLGQRVGLSCVLSLGVILWPIQAMAAASFVGQWSCTGTLQQPLFQVVMATQDQYQADGTYRTQGTLTVSLHGQPLQIKYSVNGVGTWQQQDQQLTLKATHLQVENVTHPEWEAMFHLKKLIPKQVGGTFDIVSLTPTTFQIRPKRVNDSIQCQAIR